MNHKKNTSNKSREMSSLSKVLDINSGNTEEILKKLMIYINNHNVYNINRIANILSVNINKAFQARKKEKLKEAVKKNEHPNAVINKELIINSYQNDGLSYKKIKKLILLNCETEEERNEVLSESTIDRHLHNIWGIPKDKNRRIPIEAAQARRKSNSSS